MLLLLGRRCWAVESFVVLSRSRPCSTYALCSPYDAVLENRSCWYSVPRLGANSYFVAVIAYLGCRGSSGWHEKHGYSASA